MNLEPSELLGNFILVTVSFLLLIILVRVFAWDNITAILEQRATKIAQDIDQAEEKNKEASVLLDQRKSELKVSQEEGKQIVQDSIERAKEEKTSILNQAKEEARHLKESTTQELAIEKSDATRAVRTEAVGLAVQLAERIMGQEFTPEQHSQLVDRYLDQLGE